MRSVLSPSGLKSSDEMRGLIKRRVVPSQIFLLGIVLIISACASPVSGGEPVSGPVPGAMETLIFETAAAARTQTALVLPVSQTPTITLTPSRTPTQTATPTATVLFLFPTKTKVVVLTNTPVSGLESSVGGSGSGKATATLAPNEHDYSGSLHCALVGQDPPDGTVFRPRKKFTVVWTIKNTGTAAWRKHTIDYRYIGGDKFHDKGLYNMNFILDPGETIDIDVEMYAPKQPGNYETVWVVGLNKGSMCTMTLSIVVK